MSEAGDVRSWWRDNPMTYGAEHGGTGYRDGTFKLGTAEFFDRLDREFYSWNTPLHGRKPFDRLFPYEAYGAGSNVLEIGCGLGTLAMNWAETGAALTAVDLNETSIAQTRRRFELKGLPGRIEQMDARELAFADGDRDVVQNGNGGVTRADAGDLKHGRSTLCRDRLR